MRPVAGMGKSMADELAVAALVRKRAELAGRIDHARREMDGMLASLAALDATLRLFDPAIRVESIRPKAHRPGNGHASPGFETRDVLAALREAPGPLTAREIASRLLTQAGREADQTALRRAADAIGKALRRQRAKGVVVREMGPGQSALWRKEGQALIR
jgi:hypothetical protein